ncbi:uncharacterized protein JCM6883_001044 [Sporobolomyces salmoneus]|uniref:uncharacterized protein n=1 Tax=Sporobolomyces salmoneus TaxID=183962 RepID=UPI00317E75F9
MQRTLFNTLSSQLRRTVNVTQSTRVQSSVVPSAARYISISPRLSFPGPNPVPTASEDAVAADRGETVEEDITTTVKQTVHKVVQKGENEDAQHPGKSQLDHLESPSISEEAVHAEKHASDPLPDHQKASSSSSSSATTASTSFASKEQVDAQHPGRAAAPEGLDNPSLSEAFVHADKGPDPLAGKTKNASSHPIDTASGVASNVASAASKVAGAVKDAVGLGGKRSFSTSVRQMKEGETQHLEKSGHDHLDKPSVAEEETHADKSNKDPLPKEQKASTRKGDKAGIADSKSQQSK